MCLLHDVRPEFSQDGFRCIYGWMKIYAVYRCLVSVCWSPCQRLLTNERHGVCYDGSLSISLSLLLALTIALCGDQPPPRPDGRHPSPELGPLMAATEGIQGGWCSGIISRSENREWKG